MTGRMTVAVIEGDGIGVDVTRAAIEVIDAALSAAGAAPLIYDPIEAGADYYVKTGCDIEPGGEERAGAADAILLGAIGLPTVRREDGTEVAPHLRLRDRFGLYAGVRPVRAYRNGPRRLADPRADAIDLVVLRESTEGLFYSAATHGRGQVTGDNEVRDTLRITRTTTEKLHEFAFKLARKRKQRGGPGRVTCVDKANVFASMAFFRKIFDETARRHPDIEAGHAYVDAQALNLVRQPWEADVLVMENMFGDILSDLGGGLVGGMGMAACAEIGDNQRPVPARAWQRARHHGPGQGQSAGGDSERQDDAELPGRTIRRGALCRGCTDGRSRRAWGLRGRPAASGRIRRRDGNPRHHGGNPQSTGGVPNTRMSNLLQIHLFSAVIVGPLHEAVGREGVS